MCYGSDSFLMGLVASGNSYVMVLWLTCILSRFLSLQNVYFSSYNRSISVIGLFVDFFVVDDLLLSNSYLPNEGFVMIMTKLNGTQSVC